MESHKRHAGQHALAFAMPKKAPREGLQLRMFGPLAATRQGREIALPRSRKVRALLGYLALAPRPALRAHLCELLWDIADDPRRELRWCLTKLRSVTDDTRRRRLISDKQWVSIDRSDVEIDATKFSQVIEGVLVEGSVDELKFLTSMIQGDLLEGLTVDRSPMFDNWLHGQRHRFMSWHARALARIAKLLPTEDEEVLAVLRKRIDLVPLEDNAHIDLVCALRARGHLAEAEHHLAMTVRLYQREGLDPKPFQDAWSAPRKTRVGSAAQQVPASVAASTAISLQQVPTRRASIAVMPFEGSSLADKRVADGLTYDITVGLAKLRSLLVIAQATTFALRERGVCETDAEALLGVDYVATGKVARHGSDLRITLELRSSQSRRVMWAEEYTIRGDEAVQAPGTIATRIVSCLDAEIQLAESNRAILKPPNSLDAWELHHRGLWHMYRFTIADNDKAQGLFRRAIELDPTFSRAYAGLSFTHWQNAFTFRPTEKQVERDRAFDAAGLGLQADPRDPAAHWAMGRALWLREENAASLSALNDAVALSPSFAVAHYMRGFVEAQSGDAVRAVEAIDIACRLSPFDPMFYAMCVTRAFALISLERHKEAADWAIRGARKPNAHVHAHACAALVLAVAGKLSEAAREVAVVHKLRPNYRVDDFFSSYRVIVDDTRARLRAAARQLGIG